MTKEPIFTKTRLRNFLKKNSDKTFQMMECEDCIGATYLHHQGFKNAEFSFNELDKLIVAINECLDISLDIQKLAATVRPRGGPIGPTPGDVIEGRG